MNQNESRLIIECQIGSGIWDVIEAEGRVVCKSVSQVVSQEGIQDTIFEFIN